MRARTILAALLATLPGCGYSTGLSLPQGRRTIGIELFGNDSYERDLERELHTVLLRKTRELLDATVVVPERADLVMRGRVIDYRRRGGIRSRDNQQLETGLTVRVEAALWDRATGETGEPVTASSQVGYTLDQKSMNEREARDRILDILAEQLVLDLVCRPGLSQEEDEER